ncbi:hypothetical protein Taro_025201 [Colocasia esculenta]|uniref:Secreted protein n=1 Tax=Colocasia esculenta TaxID=4460 RepID=A0A843VMP3_COLES|nr:hypothetical protein [Colocasia esculenta]
MALVVCCVTCCVCLVALCCLVVSSGEVFPELFLACSGSGFSKNFFVLISVLLPSRLRCVVGWLVRSGGFPQNGALVVLVELHWWDCVCPHGSYGSASFSCAQLALAVGDVVCAVAMWLAVLLVEVGEPTGLLRFVVRVFVLPDWSMFELEGAGARFRMVCVVPLVVSSVGSG